MEAMPECAVVSSLLPDVVLGPLAGRPDADWHRAPAGKWCAAQIVEHLSLLLEYSEAKFESRRAHEPMRRRTRSPREWIGYHLVLGIGWIPSGWRAPAPMRPVEQPEPRAVERRFREAVQRWETLERELLPARSTDLFAKHLVLGDLTLPEWGRFHLLHCAHHAKQIRARLRG